MLYHQKEWGEGTRGVGRGGGGGHEEEHKSSIIYFKKESKQTGSGVGYKTV